MSSSNFHFQNDQGYNSRGNQNYEGFNQDSSYRSQYNDQEGEENSSSSSIYTKYLQLQIRMYVIVISSSRNASVHNFFKLKYVVNK